MNRDLGGIAGGSAVGAILIDLVVHSGDLLAAIVMFIVTQADLLVPLFGQLSTLADAIEWIPADTVNQLFLAAVAVLVAVYVARLANRAWRRING